MAGVETLRAPQLVVASRAWPSASKDARSSAPPSEALASAKEAALLIPRSRLDSETDTASRLRVGVTFASWGEVVSVSVRPDDEGSVIHVESRSRLALIDWGKNRANVRTALDGI
jgi:uncharacterized protein (DUF1499 family)